MSLQEMNHPKLILFRELIIQLLTTIKQDLRKSKLDEIHIESTVAQDTTMDPSKYLEYFLIGLSSNKTRDTTLSFLEKMYKEEGVVSRRSLPKEFLSSIIKTIEVENYSISMCRFLGALLTNEDTRISN
jgi:hypothetical protein